MGWMLTLNELNLLALVPIRKVQSGEKKTDSKLQKCPELKSQTQIRSKNHDVGTTPSSASTQPHRQQRQNQQQPVLQYPRAKTKEDEDAEFRADGRGVKSFLNRPIRKRFSWSQFLSPPILFSLPFSRSSHRSISSLHIGSIFFVVV